MERKTSSNLKKNPRKTANWFSIVTFWWVNGFFRTNKNKPVENDDLYQIMDIDTSTYICDRLEKEWDLEVNRKGESASLVKALWKTFKWQWLVLAIPTFVEEFLRVFSPFCLRGLLRYFEGTGSYEQALLYAGGIVGITATLTLTHHILFYHLQQLGWHIRVATSALMYKKTLKLSQVSLSSISTGQIVNLSSTDVVRYDLVTIFLHYVWLAPLQSALIIYLAWSQVGISSLLGIASIIVTTITQSTVGRQFGKIRSKMVLITDKRIRMMNEVISSMRVIKMYTWEDSFHKVVAQLRRNEVVELLKAATLRAFNFSMIFLSSKLNSMVIFISYVMMGGQLSASLVFTTIGLFDVLRSTVGIFFPAAIERLSECRISTKRIQDFLLLGEIEGSQMIGENHHDDDDEADLKKKDLDLAIKLDNVSCKWTNDEKSVEVLRGISLRINKKELIGVVGHTGAGKSSLLVALLRELHVSAGDVTIHGRISYAAQNPWIFYGTVRDNILFGEEYEADRYNQVADACCLLQDFKNLRKGDMTMIGERGVTLSGGQRARVNLARAVYRAHKSNIFLLDDPLSALDAKIARRVFDNCICGYLKNKTRILITHQVNFLHNVDNIAVFKEGKMSHFDKYDVLFGEGGCCVSLSDEMMVANNNEQADDGAPKRPGLIDDDSEESGSKQNDVGAVSATEEEKKKQLSVGNNNDLGHRGVKFVNGRGGVVSEEENVRLLEKSDNAEKAGDENIEEEELDEGKAVGHVKGRVYWKYLGYNKPVLAIVVILAICNHFTALLNDWWIANWATKSNEYMEEREENISRALSEPQVDWNDTGAVMTSPSPPFAPMPKFDNNYYVKIYLITNALSAFFIFTRAIAQFQYCVRSGINLHDRMFYAILNTTVRFFDTNPVGRILNRFSKDMGFVDDLLPSTFMDFIYLLSLSVVSVIVACVVNYFILLVIIPLMIFFLFLRRLYVTKSRDIKRLEGNNRSPVFSHLSNTLDGLTTVRAFHMQEPFINKFHSMQDLHSASWYMFLVSSRWFGQRLDILCVVFISSVAFLSLGFVNREANPGNVGLAISYSIQLIGMFQWCIRQSTEVENLMTSVERIQEYADLEAEEISRNEDYQQVAAEWPREGAITFDKLCFSHYPGGPEVLKELSFSVQAKQKIGVIGRTGAGKSSLIAALYRLNNFDSGDIIIDGVKISKIELKKLRSSQSIIPQDPRLFYGTIRFNMDPFSLHTDEELWNSLDKVQLKERVSKYELKLDTVVSEGGSNLSVGERQLFCLSRAILRKTKIVMIDEATANVDEKTDRLIQRALRDSSQHCTVLTIAHRLNTIIDCNQVLVMEKGRAVEFGEPWELIERSRNDPNYNSHLYSLIQSYNPNEAEKLIQDAHEAYLERRGPSLKEE